MAKQPPHTGGMSKVRFIMLDAELPSGDVEQITQAIQNALRPVQAVQPRRMTSIPMNQRVNDALGEVAEEEEETISSELIDGDDESNDPGPMKRVTPSRPRKYRSPKVILDVDLKADQSWADFLAPYKFGSILDKYLLVAAWFKEERSIDSITSDHVYTCFRAAGWSTAIDDFGQPLRRLRSDQFMEGDPKKGFVINHLGLARVEKMKGA